jgi:hypothetical protein
MTRHRTAIALACALALGVVGCSDPAAADRSLGPTAPAARVREIVTKSGYRLEIPVWLELAPDKLDRALRELDASIVAFSATLRENVEPEAVAVYPFGFEAFPVDDGLAAGYTHDGRIVIAWYRDPPHLRALAHELCHVARPHLSHSEIDADERLSAARAAAEAAQASVRPDPE